MRRLLIALALCGAVWGQYTPPSATPGSNGSGIICATVSLTSQSGSITATNLQCNGAQAPAGLYMILFDNYTTSGQSGSGTVNSSFGWHNPDGAIAVTQQSLVAGNGFVTTLNGNVNQNTNNNTLTSFSFRHDGTANITYSTTYAATGKYDLYIVLKRLL